MKPLMLCLALLATPALAGEPQVTLSLRFDPASLTLLQERGELIVMSAYYYGEPLAENRLAVDEMGRIFLGAEEMTIWPKDQTLVIGASLAAAPVASVLAPFVNVNVYSARISSDDNLLNCDLVEGPVAALATAPQTIQCSLIDG